MFRIFQLKWKSIPFSWQRIYLRAQHSITVREEKHCKSNPVCLYFYNNVCVFKFIRLSVISSECRFLVTSLASSCLRQTRKKKVHVWCLRFFFSEARDPLYEQEQDQKENCKRNFAYDWFLAIPRSSSLILHSSPRFPVWVASSASVSQSVSQPSSSSRVTQKLIPLCQRHHQKPSQGKSNFLFMNLSFVCTWQDANVELNFRHKIICCDKNHTFSIKLCEWGSG